MAFLIGWMKRQDTGSMALWVYGGNWKLDISNTWSRKLISQQGWIEFLFLTFQEKILKKKIWHQYFSKIMKYFLKGNKDALVVIVISVGVGIVIVVNVVIVIDIGDIKLLISQSSVYFRRSMRWCYLTVFMIRTVEAPPINNFV